MLIISLLYDLLLCLNSKAVHEIVYKFTTVITLIVGAKLQATNRVPRPVDRGTATRYGG